MSEFDFDCAIVGSSPLLMMLALKLQKSGKSVVLFEAEQNFGGAWQNEHVEGIGLVECACHLLEWYAGGYELLARLSGCKFVASDPQPVRIYRDGTVEPYTSRNKIAAALYHELRGFATSLVRLLFSKGRTWSDRVKTVESKRNSLLFYLRFRLRGAKQFDAIQRPALGFTHFVDNLANKVSSSGIRVINAKVDSVSDEEDSAVLGYSDQKVRVKKIFLGESSIIDDMRNQSDVAKEPYHHLVVGVPANSVEIRSDYIHLPDDQLFHRITYLRDIDNDDNRTEALFLVQLRDQTAGENQDAIRDLFLRCRIIISNMTYVQVHKTFTKSYFGRASSVLYLDSLRSVRYVRTIGDLARNVVIEPEFREHAAKQPRKLVLSPKTVGLMVGSAIMAGAAYIIGITPDLIADILP
ncbi:NAD(P)-binding protein [Mesorhizobium sp. SP-1A]|uniref:NAD(P)-binding protein n=1 Tax=Mesorhizobium sp. SP-1A TaxID=3077840 RepID=UPI0028F6C996|nr:NAD(P)-binding protein [Mesorhizobium sp. SP-1A]